MSFVIKLSDGASPIELIKNRERQASKRDKCEGNGMDVRVRYEVNDAENISGVGGQVIMASSCSVLFL